MNGETVQIDGLWSLTNGIGINDGSEGTVYFAAGLTGEQDGLFGSLAAVREPSACAMMLLGFLANGLRTRRKLGSCYFRKACLRFTCRRGYDIIAGSSAITLINRAVAAIRPWKSRDLSAVRSQRSRLVPS